MTDTSDLAKLLLHVLLKVAHAPASGGGAIVYIDLLRAGLAYLEQRSGSPAISDWHKEATNLRAQLAAQRNSRLAAPTARDLRNRRCPWESNPRSALPDRQLRKFPGGVFRFDALKQRPSRHNPDKLIAIFAPCGIDQRLRIGQRANTQNGMMGKTPWAMAGPQAGHGKIELPVLTVSLKWAWRA